MRNVTRLWPRLFHLEGPDRVIMALRWLALGLVLLLSFFEPFTEGVLIPTSTVILGAVIYNLLIQALGHIFPWPRLPLNILALDTLVATVAIYLTGGFHSSFFIVDYFVILGIAFHLNLVQTVLLALLINCLCVAVCFINPASRQLPYAIYSLAATSAPLLTDRHPGCSIPGTTAPGAAGDRKGKGSGGPPRSPE